MEKPLLSIVVPTKDRYFYLKYLVDLIATFKSDEIELVIQDNSTDNTEILDFLHKKDYTFVRYFYNKEQLSMSKNSDLSILNSSGEFICFIGDDDGVTRYAIECARWMKEKGFNIVKSAFAIYKWPSFISPKHYDVSSCIFYNNFSLTYNIIDCKESLRLLLSSGIDTLGSMPKVYNGIVRKTTLDKIYRKCNTFFPGPSPDMANAVALALTEDTFVFVDAPIIIGGHSSNIGGGANRYRKKYGPLEDQPFIAQEHIDNWSINIPKIWASRSIWPESAITAIKALNKEEYLTGINYEIIYRKFVVEHPELARLAFPLSKKKFRLFMRVLFSTMVKSAFVFINYYKYKVNNLYAGDKIYRGYNNIILAESSFAKTITEFKPIEKKQ